MNIMQKPKIDKVVLSAGAVGNDLEKARKLLEIISGMKAKVTRSGPRKRIPSFNVRPNMELGVIVTIRGAKKKNEVLLKLLGAIDNALKSKQVADGHFSFGIREYIDIPGMEYIREIGIRGLNVTVVFEKPGLRVKHKKIKGGHVPARQRVSKEEIIKFMEDNYKTKVIAR